MFFSRKSRGAWVFLLASLVLPACSTTGGGARTGEVAPTDDFEERMSGYSEAALIRPAGTEDDGTVLVATKTCSAADRARLDAMFPISGARAVQSEKTNAPFGLPLVDVPNEHEVYLYHDEYVLLYNTDLRLPVFATYRLRSGDIQKGDRQQCFRPDPRLPPEERSNPTDYHGSTDLDKGHLVPDADMQRSDDAVMNTYFMSNMMPQFGSVNSGSWLYLETATRLWADELGDILVVSGPVFDRDADHVRDADADAERAPPTRRVAKPTGFYRIVVALGDAGPPRAIAFLLPHIQASTAPNADYVPTKLVTIDEIEAVTGYDFFPDLPDDLEDAMEAVKEDDLWCRGKCSGSPES